MGEQTGTERTDLLWEESRCGQTKRQENLVNKGKMGRHPLAGPDRYATKRVHREQESLRKRSLSGKWGEWKNVRSSQSKDTGGMRAQDPQTVDTQQLRPFVHRLVEIFRIMKDVKVTSSL